MMKQKVVIDSFHFLRFFSFFSCLQAIEENAKIQKIQQEEYEKKVTEVRERNEQRAEQARYTDLWYTFVDPYATDVDERGSDGAHKAVGVLVIKNGFSSSSSCRNMS